MKSKRKKKLACLDEASHVKGCKHEKKQVTNNMKDLIFLPHPQHFICSQDCLFRLATYTNGYIISTVGEYVPTYKRGENEKFEDIGYNRKYETMVFKAGKRKDKEAKCCPYEVKDYSEIDFKGYNDAEAAYKGHMEMCKKYASS